MKLTEKQVIKIMEIINKYKYAMSLTDFTFFVKDTILEADGKWVETEIDIFDNEMKIEVSQSFLEADLKKQENMIVHEMYHGLFLYHKMSARECNSAEAYKHYEEMFINRITKIFEDWFQREDI